MTYILGLTGSIATGKSTVSKIFGDYGFPIVDADKIAREIVAPGTKGLQNIVAHFGATVLQEDGMLDRKKLGQIVFTHPEKRTLLNQLNGSLIREEIFRQIKQWQDQKVPLVVLDIPLLFESHYEQYTDGVMVAYVPRALELERLIQRDGYTKEAALQRMNSQIDIEEKRKLADFYTDNSGSLENLKPQVHQFLVTHHFLKK